MAERLNTHAYDGNLYECVRGLNVSDDQKRSAFGNLANQFTNARALRWLTAITNDIGREPNFDVSNNQYADDVLWAVYQKMFRDGELRDDMDEMISLLEEQLADIHGGPCPPGRATRIYQIWLIVKEM
jgi:hypothetical protein